MNSTYIQLKQNLEYLKMKQMLLHLDEVLDFIPCRCHPYGRTPRKRKMQA